MVHLHAAPQGQKPGDVNNSHGCTMQFDAADVNRLPLEIVQVALLSQKGRAMLCVCQ